MPPQVEWEPLPGPPDLDGTVPDTPIYDVLEEDASDLVGKPWTYGVRIRQAAGLPMTTEKAYCAFSLFGEDYQTETVEQLTSSPVFIQPSEAHYTAVLHLPEVTEKHLAVLKSESGLDISLFASPVVDVPKNRISAANSTIVQRIKGVGGSAGSGVAESDAKSEPVEAPAGVDEHRRRVEELEKLVGSLQQRVADLELENAKLREAASEGVAVEA